MQEVAKRLASARSVCEVGHILGDACERTLPFGTFAFIVFAPSPGEEASVVVRSGEFPVESLLKRFPEILMAMKRDLGGIDAALREQRAYDVDVKFPIATLKDTELLNDHWRPVHCEQQLVAPFWHQGAPIGYCVAFRGLKEARFMPADLRYIEGLRVHAERLDGIVSLKGGELSQTLDALSQTFPYPAFLFETGGRLRWMSDEGAVRLGVAAARIGTRRLIHGNATLEGLSRYASALALDPVASNDAGLRSAGILRRNESFVVRRFGENGSPLFLLAFTPAMAGLPGDRGVASKALLPRLGTVESKVARLAAEGYTVLNIAAQLAITEATVRTHIHRVYVKLGVHGRAELAFALLRGSGSGPDG